MVYAAAIAFRVLVSWCRSRCSAWDCSARSGWRTCGFVTALLVRYAPAERPGPKWASVGSAIVVGTWVVTTVLFAWYAPP